MFMNSNFDADDLYEEFAHDTFAPSTVLTGIDAATRLATRIGRKSVRDIEAGDEVLTFDNGFRCVRAVQRSVLTLRYDTLPIYVPAGALGNQQEFTVPEKQVVMIENDRAEMLFGDPFALVRAEDLVGYNKICRIVPYQELEVVKLDFGTDEVVFGGGGELFFCPVSWRSLQRSDVNYGKSPYTVLKSQIAVRLMAPKDPAQNGKMNSMERGSYPYPEFNQANGIAS